MFELVKDITTPLEPIGPDTLGAEVFERFNADRTLLAIPVVDKAGRPLAIVERERFMLRLAAEYGRALYAQRPIALLMDEAPLVVEASTPLADFTHHALVHQASELTRGFVIVEGGVYRGVGSLLSLLQAVAADNAQKVVEVTQLARQLEDAQKEAGLAHERLREAVDSMPDSLALFDDHDRLVLWNNKYRELHPHLQETLRPGVAFRELVEAGLQVGEYALGAEEREAFVSRRLELHQADSSKHEQALTDGRWLRVEERRTPGGGVVSVCVDITDIKHREASFRLLFAANPAPMWVLERDTLRFLAVNEAAVEDYGYSAEAFARMTVYDLLPPEEAKALREIRTFDRWLANEGARVWRHQKAGGGEILTQPYLGQLEYEGRPAFLVAIFDVTEVRAGEAAMARARDVAEAANRAKSEFLANMSHEIRTPLNGVMGVAEVLGKTDLKPRQREMVEIIASSAESLHTILSDILDIARVEAGRLSIQDEPYELRKAVTGAWSLAALRAEGKGLQARLSIEAAAPDWVWGDDARLKQILNNLLSNAVKFTEAGEVSLNVRTVGADLVFSISDTGLGIPAAALPHLFERFAQADGGITRQFGGSGLGLSISRHLAELMGGSLEVASSEGRGSTFTLTLPLRLASPAVAQAPAPDVAAPSDKAIRILLAEDNPTNVKVVRLILETVGVELAWVENGREAVDILEQEAFDLVLMDLQMPVLDGLSAIAEIRSRERELARPPVPVIVLSANAMPEDMQGSVAAGAQAHISKPVSAAGLIGAIATLLSSQEAGVVAAAS